MSTKISAEHEELESEYRRLLRRLESEKIQRDPQTYSIQKQITEVREQLDTIRAAAWTPKAVEHLEAAQKARDEIRQRVIDGDTKITPLQIATAEQNLSHAQLTLQASHEANQLKAEQLNRAKFTEHADKLTNPNGEIAGLMWEAHRASDEAHRAMQKAGMARAAAQDEIEKTIRKAKVLRAHAPDGVSFNEIGQPLSCVLSNGAHYSKDMSLGEMQAALIAIGAAKADTEAE
ncbi:hypothetical protein [Nocardiopsis nanhaiensis]